MKQKTLSTFFIFSLYATGLLHGLTGIAHAQEEGDFSRSYRTIKEYIQSGSFLGKRTYQYQCFYSYYNSYSQSLTSSSISDDKTKNSSPEKVTTYRNNLSNYSASLIENTSENGLLVEWQDIDIRNDYSIFGSTTYEIIDEETMISKTSTITITRDSNTHNLVSERQEIEIKTQLINGIPVKISKTVNGNPSELKITTHRIPNDPFSTSFSTFILTSQENDEKNPEIRHCIFTQVGLKSYTELSSEVIVGKWTLDSSSLVFEFYNNGSFKILNDKFQVFEFDSGKYKIENNLLTLFIPSLQGVLEEVMEINFQSFTELVIVSGSQNHPFSFRKTIE